MSQLISTTEGYAKAGVAYVGGCFVGGLSQGLSGALWGKISGGGSSSTGVNDAYLIANALTEVGLLLFAMGFIGPRLTSSNQLFFTIGGLESLTTAAVVGSAAAQMLISKL